MFRVWVIVFFLFLWSCSPKAILSRSRNAGNQLTSAGTNTGGGAGGGGGDPGKFEIPIEMFDAGFHSTGAAPTAIELRTYIDTAAYDGTVNYVWEIVASNDDAVAQNATLIDSANAVKATISVAAGASIRRYSTTFTPNVGNDYYRVQFPDTTAPITVAVFEGRIRVQQQSATMTKLFIPLGSATATATSIVNALPYPAIDNTTNNVYGQDNPQYFGVWRKDTSSMATISGGTPWTFEATISTVLAGTCYVSLFNKTSGLQIAASEVSAANPSTNLYVSASFSNAEANFTEGDDIEIRFRGSSGVNGCYLHKAGLWVSLTSVSKTESWYRIGRQVDMTAASSGTRAEQRTLMDTALFGGPTVWFEAHGWDPAASVNTVTLFSAGTSDTATAGSSITTVTLPVARGRVRTVGNPALTDNDRYIFLWNNPGIGAAKLTHSFIVIQNQ